jgi:hypothetical protein
VSNAKLCYYLPDYHCCLPWWMHIHSGCSFHGGGSWPTASRQTSNVHIAIFEVFHPTSHTAATHAGILIDMIKLVKNVCSRNVLFYKEFNHSMQVKWYSIYSPFVTGDYEAWLHVYWTYIPDCRKQLQLSAI